MNQLQIKLDAFWEEHNKRLNTIMGMNMVKTKFEIARELTDFAIWVDDEMDKFCNS